MVDIEQWMAGYERAWRSDDPDDVAALFAEDAVYFTAPFREPIRGRAAIVSWWVAEDEPSEPSFQWWVVSVTDDTAVVEGRTIYPGDTDYLNLWVIRFDESARATSFTEWWMVDR